MVRERLFGDAAGTLLLDGVERAALEEACRRGDAEHVVERIWRRDHTVWKPEPREIADRLGWLDSPTGMHVALPRIRELTEAVRRDGYADVILLGMGGSSLAPEVFARTFGHPPGFPRVTILDSTDPGAVLDAARRADPSRTLYVVSTKSGGTIETLSFFKYFYGLAGERVGRDRAGEHFIAITDPGSTLETSARDLGLRTTILNDPAVGGRYSALTGFGLVPAALGGVDTGALLGRGAAMAERCASPVTGENPGAALGALLGSMARAGRDKLTLHCSAGIAAFGAWVEQLVAESTGKEGRGILPVTGEEVGAAGVYGEDRLFVFLLLAGDRAFDRAIAELAAAGHPVLRITLGDRYDLGGEFFRWEMATAVACFHLGVNAFDQPDVEAAKVQAGRALAAYREQGALPEEAPSLRDGTLCLFGAVPGRTAREAIRGLLDRGRPGDYTAVQAYLTPGPGIDARLAGLQRAVRAGWRRAVTVGYGPRFLHSTGQLHKGGAANGCFIQLTADDREDAVIPDRFGERAGAVSFGVLKKAQVLGDRGALEQAGRTVLRVHLGADPETGLETLLRIVTGAEER